MTQPIKATPKKQAEAIPQQEQPKFKFPTETIDLPSKGIVYPKSNPLSSGKVEMKYMTAREEDIITNQNYLQKGTAVDKLLDSLIITPGVNHDDLITGDKNALLVAARVLGYGKDYKFTYDGDEMEVDLSLLENKEINLNDFQEGVNEFEYVLPTTQVPITYQLVTGKIEKAISSELKGLAKLDKINTKEISTRMKHLIVAVDGDRNKKSIREFVDNYFLAKDSKSLRDHIMKTQPDVDLTFEYETYDGEIVDKNIPITSNFFFPDGE